MDVLSRSCLDEIARRVRQWSEPAGVELAAVAPVRAGVAGAPVLIASGGPHFVRVTPRLVFTMLLRLRAESGVLVHTHLSDHVPSPADHAVTRRLVAASTVLGVELAAHLVVGPHGWSDCVADGRAASAPVESRRRPA